MVAATFRGLFLPHTLVLLDGLGGDGCGVLGGVRDLRIGRSRRDRAPSLAARHSKGEANRNYRYE